MLNLTVTYERCDVNMTVVDLWYEQSWGLVILLMRIDKWSLECQGCSINLTKINLWYEQFWGLVTTYTGESSEVCTHWGVLKLCIIRGVVLNLTMIELVDLPLYGREFVGDFNGK